MFRWLMWLVSKHCKACTFVFLSFLLILICSFMVSSFSPYVLISDRIPKPDERLGNLKEGANATIEAINNCSQTTDILPDFIECKRGTLLYSAWFDDRHAQNYIQVLLMTSRRNQPPPLSCRFPNGPTSTISVRAVIPYYEINKRYSNKRYGLFVASCILSKDLVGIPNFVNISIANECMVELPVGNTRNTSYKRDYGICIPPMFGNIRVAEVVEFLEMSQLLGASYFTFYDYSISDSVRKMLSYYERKGVAEVLPWSLPTYITDQDVHYYGQIFSMQDCLFRSINRLNFVAFNDLDEFITPLQDESMPSLLYSIHDSNYCGHCFPSARFPTVDSLTQNYSLFTQNVLRRLPQADSTHTKCVDDPQRVFEHGVHLIMQPFEGYKTNHVNWNKARVFHYRKCQPPCNSAADMKVDTTMHKYSEQLRKNVISSFVKCKVFNNAIINSIINSINNKVKF